MSTELSETVLPGGEDAVRVETMLTVLSMMFLANQAKLW